MSKDKAKNEENSDVIVKRKGIHISIVDQVVRLKKVQEMLSEEKTVKKISEELGISEQVVYNNINYLKELEVADLTSQDIAGKRAELFIELTEVEKEVKDQYENYKNKASYANDARAYLRLWKDVIESKAKMFGVDVIKTDGIVINQQINRYEKPEQVSHKVKDALASAIIGDHEEKIRQKYDENEL